MTTEPAAATHDLFISYAEADRAWVDGFLLDALEQAGVKYHSEDAFALGVPRLVEFERAIKQSTRTLLILSPAYLADTFGQFVDVLVNSYGLETATWPVIPLMLQTVELPPRLSQLVRLDAATSEAQYRALERLCAELKRPLPGPAPLPACPYPGMVPFDEADSARFFGREQEVQELVERLRLQPFLAVIGASGSGKSSLVRAGLIPALRKSQAFGSGDWLVRTMRPGAAPLETLTQLITDIPRARQLGAADSVPDAAADLALPAGTRLLLVVDQYEETFTTAGTEAQAFQQTLLRLSAATGCYVVLTARADFYTDLMTSPLWASIQANRVEITPLDEAGLRRAIMRPAELAGVAVEAALVERLVDDAAGEPGVLPLVQETLVLLWERLERRFLPMRAYEALVLTRDSYGQPNDERSGLQVAIARRADATLASLTEAQQQIARRIFLRLIQFGEGRADTRRQQPLDALRSARDDARLFDQTLQQLAQSRLITLSGVETIDDRRQTIVNGKTQPSSFVLRPSSSNVDIAHEALIRGWPALQGWLNERRESELTRRRLEGKAQEWARLGRESGGLLDEIEVLEAERWLAGAEAADIGFDEALPELVERSQAAIAAVKQAQEAARQRELAQAQALAEEQRKRAEEQAAASARLRRRALFLAGAAGVAILAMIAAMIFLQQSQRSEAEALSQKGIAEQQRSIADQQKVAAETNAAEARRQQTAAETNAAEARRQTSLAQQRERQTRISTLATQSQLALGRYPQRSLLLATEALNLSSQSSEPATPAVIDALRAGLAEISGQTLVGAEQPASAVAYSANGRYLAIGSQRGPVRLVDMQAEDPLAQPIELRGHEDQVAAITFSPSGRYLATGSYDGTAQLWDLQAADPSAAPIVLRGHTAQVLALAWSPNSRFLATGGADNTARLRDTTKLAAASIELGGHTGSIVALAWSPNGRYLATGSLDGTARLWDTQADDLAAAPQVLHGNDEIVTTLAWSADSRYLATGGGEQIFTIWLWDLTKLDSPQQLQGHVLAVTSLLFSPNGQTLISASRDRTTRLWDLRAADPSATPIVLRGHADEIRAATLSPDGGLLATGGRDNTVRLWNLADRDPNADVRVLKGHDAAIFALAFNADASALVTASDDGTARLWQLNGDSNDGSSIVRDADSEGSVTALGWSPDGRYLATSQADGKARLWDRRAGTSSALTVLPGEKGSSNGLAWRPDGQILATASDGPDVQLWDLNSANFTTHPALLPGPADGTLTLAWSPDGKYLAGSSPDNTIWLWDLQTADPGSAPMMLKGYDQPVYRLAWSPDSHMLASASVDTTVRLWDVRAANPSNAPIVLKGHERAVVAVAFSPDGRALASGSWDGTARVWDLSSGTPSADPIVLHGHTKEVVAVAWSTDERYLVTTSYDASARQWDMRAADPSANAIVLNDTSSVTAAAFSPDGHTLATGNVGASVRLWPLELPRLIDLACRAAGRNLAWEEWQQFFEQAEYRRTCANLPPHASYINHLLDDAAVQAKAGNIPAALAAYTTVQQLSPQYQIDAEHWNALCRMGALSGKVKQVLEACGAAVALAPSAGDTHDSRGLARALTGDTTGAADDFAAYIAWEQQQLTPDTDAIAQRERWIVDLKAGRNPFDEDTLKQLRGEEQ